MPDVPMEDGYYWARHDDGTTFIAFREAGRWYLPGVGEALDVFGARRVETCLICPIPRPQN